MSVGKLSFILSSIAFLFSTVLFAQGNNIGTIRGTVVDDSTRQPLEFVNVMLRAKADSGSVTGTITGKDGKFAIEAVPAGEYYIALSLISYKEKQTKTFVIDPGHKKLNVGTVGLVSKPVTIDGMTVTADKAIFNNSIDRKVYNVEQDIMSKSGSASELLQNVPSIQVDIDGTVSLRGSSNVRILVDGKSSMLMDKNSAEVLQQIPASSIERIEVITNPSAKYRPDGTSGIINIVMKKNIFSGLNGSVTANGGNKERYNGTLRLNYKPEDYNVYGSYSVRHDSRNRTATDYRAQTDSSAHPTYFNQNTISAATPLSHSATLGIDYHLDEENDFGVSGNYFHNGFTRIDTTNNAGQNSVHRTTQLYNRTRLDPEYEDEYGGKSYFEHKFPGEDHTLRLEFNLSRSPEVEDNHYSDIYLFPAAPSTYDNMRIDHADKRTEFSLDYSNPLGEDERFEAGYAGQINGNDFNYLSQTGDSLGRQFTVDGTKTNHFIYDEAIHALYVTYDRSFGDFRLKAGLRPELASRTMNLLTKDSSFSDNYFNLYPTLHLACKVSAIAEAQLNYSRRVNRPEGEDLNPFPEYRDPRNFQAGNPHLLPEYIHSIGLGCQFQYEHMTILPDIFYHYTYNKFTQITEILNDSTLRTTRTNLSHDQSAGMELVVSGNASEVLSLNASVNGFYQQIDATNLGYSEKKSDVSWSGNLTLNIHPAQSTMVQVNSNYQSSRLTPQGERVPSYVMNLGMRQDLMERKISLTLTVADIFRTQKRELDLNTMLLNRIALDKRDGGIVYFGVTYHFDNPPKNGKDEQMRYDE